MNETTTIRVNKDIYNMVKSLARQQNENIQDIIEHAVTEYKKKKFFEDLNSAYAKLKSDPMAWKEELDERYEWDHVLNDGLENNNEDK
jgi:predicted CopG family antitoxin